MEWSIVWSIVKYNVLYPGLRVPTLARTFEVQDTGFCLHFEPHDWAQMSYLAKPGLSLPMACQHACVRVYIYIYKIT